MWGLQVAVTLHWRGVRAVSKARPCSTDMEFSSTLKLLQALRLLLLLSLRLYKCSLICRSSSCYTVNSRIDLACLCLLGGGSSSPPLFNLYKLSDLLLLFLIKLRSLPDSICLMQGLHLFDILGDLEPRPQHSCSLHYCFSLQGVDQSFSGSQVVCPLPLCWLAVVCLHHAL